MVNGLKGMTLSTVSGVAYQNLQIELCENTAHSILICKRAAQTFAYVCKYILSDVTKQNKKNWGFKYFVSGLAGT